MSSLPIIIDSLIKRQDILDRYDNFLLDCDGVIWEGDLVLPGIKITLDYLKLIGKNILFVTNNATKSRSKNKFKFDKLNLQCELVS